MKEDKWNIFANELFIFKGVTFKVNEDIFQITTGDDKEEWTTFIETENGVKEIKVFDNFEKCSTEKLFNGKSLQELILVENIPFDFM